MNKDAFTLTRFSFSVVFFLLISATTHAQRPQFSPVKNYAGLLVGIEWNTLSGLKGVEFALGF